VSCLHASSALALGLGDLKLDSYLNEPLRAEVSLLDTANLHEDQIRIRLATREDFDKLGVERAYFLTSIKFEVRLDESGRGRVILTSEDPVLEPYLDFIVEARWPTGRLLREYTVLVDPPVFDESAQVVSATQRVIEVEGEQVPASAPAKKKSETAVQTTGTRVDVRESDLGPGEMPRREFGSDAAERPAPGGRYMIRRDDTLWEIAQQARSGGASVHQTMLEIQRLNPDAFLDGNINRIKAGYIIYLPTSDDMGARDQAAALAEVRQQNEDWRAGRASEGVAAGPALRITADSETADREDAGDTGEAGDAAGAGAAGDYVPGGAAAEDLEKAELARAELEERLVAMEQQVETLERIVNLKDEQIAALQGALAESGAEDAAAGSGEGPGTPEPAMSEPSLEPGLAAMGDVSDAGEEGDAAAGEERVTPAEESAAEKETAAEASTSVARTAGKDEAAPAAAAKAPAKAAAESGGIFSYLLYGLGALVLAILAFLFVRRRGGESEVTDEGESAVSAGSADVFADVRLKDENLEVAAVEEALPEAAETAEFEPEPTRDNRGYGERKHDEYASDVDAGDALAEADIYVAYGRYPQAVDLLKNASANEPQNPAYRLKLLEIQAEMDDRDGVMEQLAALEKMGNADALARAEEVLAVMQGRAPAPRAAAVRAPVQEAPEPMAGSPAEPELESDFGELEIEEPVSGTAVADDLDLSEDFDREPTPAREEEEDLVIASEANGMSTKLDLARAYLDMGDEEGARQILEEVVAEGAEELKAEARALLERID
jgi:pilus assembly protein FimV